MDSSNFHHILSIFVILIGLCYGDGMLPNLMDGAVRGSVTFTTTLKPTDPFLIKWDVNTTSIINSIFSYTIGPEYEGRITLDRSTGSLELRDLTLRDRGNYLLTIISEIGGAQIQGRTTLRVYEGVSIPTIKISTSPPIMEGASVNLTCDAAGSISNLQWMKDGQVLSSNRVLSLRPVNRTDSGLYLCRVSNPVSSQDATYNLTVNSTMTAEGSLSAGAIARIVIGLLVVVAGSGVAVLYFIKKTKLKSKTNSQRHQQAPPVDPPDSTYENFPPHHPAED